MIEKARLTPAIAGTEVAISRFQGLKRLPRALPWAITFRAFGAGTEIGPTGSAKDLTQMCIRPPTQVQSETTIGYFSNSIRS